MKTIMKLFFLIATGLVAFYFFGTQNKDSIRLDNAYVSGRVLQISSTAQGIIAEQTPDRGAMVKKGALLYYLDSTQWQLEIERLTDELYNVVKQQQLTCLNGKVEELQLESALVDVQYKQNISNRAKDLFQVKAISQERIDEINNDMALSQINAMLARQRIESVKLENQLTIAERSEVKLILTMLKQAFYQLSKLNIYAPYDGYIYEVYAYAGQMVSEGDHLMTFVPQEELLVEVNALESEIKYLQPGAEVIVRPDVYSGSIEFKGKVESIVPSTAAVFSGIPRNNTDSNWIKVAQRVPVLVSIDKTDAVVNLPIGSSVEVELPLQGGFGKAVAATAQLSTEEAESTVTVKSDIDHERLPWFQNYQNHVTQAFARISNIRSQQQLGDCGL